MWLAQDEQIATRTNIITLFRDIVHVVPSCTFVLDGLDECTWIGEDRTGQNTVARFIEAISRAIADTTSRIMIVSRDEPEIRRALSDVTGFLELKISPQDVRHDVLLFSRSIVDRKLSKKDEITKSDISLKMADRCNGQFIWVKMQEGSLRNWKNKKQLEDAIDKTPALLEHLYERNWTRMSRLPIEERNRAYSLLRWAAFSLRPLTVCEIAEAVLIENERDQLHLDEIPDFVDEEYIDSEILGPCGSLLEIRNSTSETCAALKTVHLAHFSIRQYFLCHTSAQGELLIANHNLQYSSESLENARLAILCLRYVDYQDVWEGVFHVEEGNVKRSFRDYAAGVWYEHAAASGSTDPTLVDLMNGLFDTRNPNWDRWRKWVDLNIETLQLYESSDESPASPLHYASQLGLVEVVRHQLKNGNSEVDGKHACGTALGVASEKGNVDVVDLLLEARADATITDSAGWTPLHSASDRGHTQVVNLLLEYGADAMATTNTGFTPLHAASESGHVDVVNLLINKVANLSFTDTNGWTPLNTASFNGHTGVVELLLAQGADLTVPTIHGWMPLHAASSSGHIEVVKLLLRHGADWMVSDTEGWTPLHAASSKGHTKVAELLLDQGADRNVADTEGWTPIYVASSNGHSEVVKLLIEKGADLMVETKSGWTPINGASSEGYLEVVKILLEQGADLNRADNIGLTPMISASVNGYVDIVKLLLDWGADSSIASHQGYTALHTAARHGCIDVVKVLLEHGADLNATNNIGWTPMITSSIHGYADIVKLLLNWGADAKIKNQDGRTALHSAASLGNLEVVKELIGRLGDDGATTKDSCGRTPLFLAARGGYHQVVMTMLASKLSASEKDWHGSTALFAAARNGHTKTVELLLATDDVQVDQTDGFGRTLFWWTEWNGHHQITKLLRHHAENKGTEIAYNDTPTTITIAPYDMDQPYCDACLLCIPAGWSFFHCYSCSSGNFDLCLQCTEFGVKCMDASHELLLFKPITEAR